MDMEIMEVVETILEAHLVAFTTTRAHAYLWARAETATRGFEAIAFDRDTVRFIGMPETQKVIMDTTSPQFESVASGKLMIYGMAPALDAAGVLMDLRVAEMLTKEYYLLGMERGYWAGIQSFGQRLQDAYRLDLKGLKASDHAVDTLVVLQAALAMVLMIPFEQWAKEQELMQ